MSQTILVTGGLWYIWSHAVVAFEQAGYKTVIIDNLSNTSHEVLDNMQKILGYVPDFYETGIEEKSYVPRISQKLSIVNQEIYKWTQCLEDIFWAYDFDGVLHFAGLKAVWESCVYPIDYFQNNVSGSLVLFELMNAYKVKKIVFSSSATVYSPQNNPPLQEDNLLETINPYGTSKLLVEYILQDMVRFSHFQVANLRYFNPIGAHPSGLLWENPQGIPNNLFPYIFKVATKNLPYLQVFGDDYDTYDGTGVRDYIDVNDLANAHLSAYSNLHNAQWLFTYNVGTGMGLSVLDAINIVQETTGQNIPYEITSRRSGDIAESVCDITKISRELWWHAKIPMKESVLNAWRFYQNENAKTA